MEKILPSSNLYSHPGRLLEEHLIGVANLADSFCKDKSFPQQERLKILTRTIALSHDLGKATTFFQNYLKADEKEKLKFKNQKETHHGLFSAVCAYYLVKELLYRTNEDVGYYPFFAFEVVKRHHGNLQDLIDEAIFNDEDKKLVNKQLENINEAKFTVLSQHLFEAGLPIKLTKKNISDWIDRFPKELRAIKKALRLNIGDASNYLLLNLLYSILLDGDKSDVVVRDISHFDRQTGSISVNIVDTYKSKQSFQESSINAIRESAYREVINKEIDIEKRFYSINLPTGLGKTLISLSFALKLRELANTNTQGKFVPRIIYALPFLSIIEQNSDVIEKVLKANGISPYNNILLKHHHLSEISYQININEDFESDSAKIMIEGWNSEIIVTTFVQLFHTLLTNRNKNLRKFHRINNSIIILDEIQSIPIKYWLLIKTIFQFITEKLNVYVIFVTATEPLIIEKKDMVSLVERDKYFKTMNRVILKPSLDKDLTLEELYYTFKIEQDKRYLFIFNTISAAKKYYELAKADHKDISFLSTHIIPKERLTRISDMKKGKYKIVITTQLVEAGVDIDFDIVVRDLAPLDSINQAAGRCNRNNFGKEKGDVYVFSLKDENGKKFSSYIYDSVLIDITKKILGKHQEIQEQEFLELINNYYKETFEKKSHDESRKILEAIGKLRYDSEERENISISDFKLIDEDYPKKDVFVELDDDAKELWSKYMELKAKDLFEQKKAFDAIKADFYQYVISIPTKVKNSPQEGVFLGYVRNEVLADYYNLETGFITKDDRSIIIW
ncbi:MAG: CRISPR-associated helicase Cas3' [Candidatus Methanoperedens sp.]|nr:CRISPR-associated helicase Cas3' [Candidatus Methanoperedens sp.]